MATFEATAESDALAQRMVAAIDFRRDSLDTILAALVTATTFVLSLTCPCCRPAVAAELRQRVAQMLQEADGLAEDAEPAEHERMH